MKALFITTETNECPKYVESFQSIPGNEAEHYIFSHRRIEKCIEGKFLDSVVLKHALDYQPEVLIYLGACAGIMPSIEIFTKIRKEICPTVLMVSDAGDLFCPWHALIKRYDDAESFSVIVSIDGVKEWERQPHHLTLLTPIDPKRFPDPPKLHIERPILFGFAGNVGRSHEVDGKLIGRRHKVQPMEKFGLRIRQRDAQEDSQEGHYRVSASYQKMCDFMSSSRITPNYAFTGSHNGMHVKGRVVGAGLAGCLLLEEKGSPTDRWFTPGEDFIYWESMEHARHLVSELGNKPEETQAFGLRLRNKVLEEHRPEKFWGKVLGKIDDLRVLPQAAA